MCANAAYMSVKVPRHVTRGQLERSVDRQTNRQTHPGVTERGNTEHTLTRDLPQNIDCPSLSIGGIYCAAVLRVLRLCPSVCPSVRAGS